MTNLPPSHVLTSRRAGVLCHLASLPQSPSPASRFAVAVDEFLSFMADAGLRLWQLLPLNPPDEFGSPYSSASLFAAHPPLLLGEQVQSVNRQQQRAFVEFCADQQFWLHDYALFRAAQRRHGELWTNWPTALRDRDAGALADLAAQEAEVIDAARSSQFHFFEMWKLLRRRAAEHRVLLFGDMPLYPAANSADVWAHQQLFQLDGDRSPKWVAGVPPDYFSASGQRWGNPVYHWEAAAAGGFAWWRARIAHQLQWFDVVRIDHFRGLEAFWRIPAGEATAIGGEWQPALGGAMLAALPEQTVATLVAEDLGIITPAVQALRDQFGLPGMCVLQFAFSGERENPHLPANVPAHAVYYTGTHDNDTTLGWYQSLPDRVRVEVNHSVGINAERSADMPWTFIDIAMQSNANTVIVPLQDWLALDGQHRLNTPGVTEGNWMWQFKLAQLDERLRERVRQIVDAAGR